MFSEAAGAEVIRVEDAGKCYHLYDKPYQRLIDGLLGKRSHGREFWALRGVSFEVHAGETLGIIGRNGAGKSTLLQMITGVLTPSVGSIQVNGKVAALLELGAGFNPEFTGRENARLNAAILGLTAREIDDCIEHIIDFSELSEFIDQSVKTYSSGMYVRLAFAVAIHVSPSVLVIDEALAVGDARFQAKCMERIRRMKSAGVTILFVSHDVAAVRQLCDRAVWLDNGRMRMLGDVLSVTSHYMETLFGDGSALMPVGLEPAGEGASADIDAKARVRAHPLLRWGSEVGCIVDAGVYSPDGRRRDVFFDSEPMEVRITFRLPEGADRSATGPAFAFKDMVGSDLVVSTTLDQQGSAIPENGNEFTVSYSLPSCLAPGDYMLVAALEDRSDGSIRYFDYIEGAQFFSTACNGRVHGRFLPEIKQLWMAVAHDVDS